MFSFKCSETHIAGITEKTAKFTGLVAVIHAESPSPLTLRFVAFTYCADKSLLFEFGFVPHLINSVSSHPVTEFLVWIFSEPFL